MLMRLYYYKNIQHRNGNKCGNVDLVWRLRERDIMGGDSYVFLFYLIEECVFNDRKRHSLSHRLTY